MKDTRRSFLVEAATLVAGVLVGGGGIRGRGARADSTVPGDGKKPKPAPKEPTPMARKYGGPPPVMKPKYGGPPRIELETITVKYGGPVMDDGHPVDRDAIRRAIQARTPVVRACYERALAKQPGLRGKVVVSFVVGRDGRARDVTIREDTIGSPAVAACVVENVKSATFQRSPDVQITYPFAFAPGG